MPYCPTFVIQVIKIIEFWNIKYEFEGRGVFFYVLVF